jgi:hypothetical protein
MGNLTEHLQHRLAEHCPAGWTCRPDVRLVDRQVARRLGFEPRADLLLERDDGARRIWLEFGVSRADPAAGITRYATWQFFGGRTAGDAFVSMPSRDVNAGRAALAAGAAMMMRAIGVPVFQITLLRNHDADAIRRLDSLTLAGLRRSRKIDAAAELDRVLQVTEPVIAHDRHPIHKADNAYTVAAQIRQWNRDIEDPATAATWGRRATRFFVHDPQSDLFAPSRFCALMAAPMAGIPVRPLGEERDAPGCMTRMLCAALGEGDTRFDGHVARTHLELRLGYGSTALEHAPAALRQAFERWHDRVRDLAPIRRGESAVLLAPGER